MHGVLCSLVQVRDQLTRDGMDIGNFEHVKQHLSIGGHCGNRFKVVLRSVHPKTGVLSPVDGVVDSLVQPVESLVTSALQSTEMSGFVNYFGLQRLNTSLGLPRVGLAMLHKDVVRGWEWDGPRTRTQAETCAVFPSVSWVNIAELAKRKRMKLAICMKW